MNDSAVYMITGAHMTTDNRQTDRNVSFTCVLTMPVLLIQVYVIHHLQEGYTGNGSFVWDPKMFHEGLISCVFFLKLM